MLNQRVSASPHARHPPTAPASAAFPLSTHYPATARVAVANVTSTVNATAASCLRTCLPCRVPYSCRSRPYDHVRHTDPYPGTPHGRLLSGDRGRRHSVCDRRPCQDSAMT